MIYRTPYKLYALAIALGLASTSVSASISAPSVCGNTSAIWNFSDSSLLTYGDPQGNATTQLSPGEFVGKAANEWWITRTPNNARPGWWPGMGGDHTTNGNGPDSRFLLVSTVANGKDKLVYSNTFTGLIAGQSYTATAWLANTYQGYLTKVSVELPDGAGGLLVPATISTQPELTDNSSSQLPWKQVQITFTAASSTQILQIVDAQNRGDGGPSTAGDDIAIDDISVSYNCPADTAPPSTAAPVPTLGAWGLVLLSLLAAVLGLCGLSRRS